MDDVDLIVPPPHPPEQAAEHRYLSMARPAETNMPNMPNLHVALFEPDIPHNTGSVARLCVATGSTLHLVGRMGFQINDRRVKRAGLDYWQHARIERHEDLQSCRNSLPRSPIFYFSAHARRSYTDAEFTPGSLLVFGSENRGLPDTVLAQEDRCFTIPIFDDRVRSLNLSTAVAIVLYEAIRQCPRQESNLRPSG